MPVSKVVATNVTKRSCFLQIQFLRRFLAFCLLVAVSQFGLAAADRAVSGSEAASKSRTLPKWELGIGVGGLSQPDYFGAGESSSYATVFPFGIYRAPSFVADREGIRGSLVGGDHWGIGLSFAGRLPLDSDDNSDRRGMDDLEAQLEFGPNFQYLLLDLPDESLTVELPVRASLSLKNGSYEGVTSNPRLVWRQRAGQWRTTVSLGAVYSNRDYHQRIYDIAPEFALPGRASYTARGGHTATRLSFSASHRGERYLAGFFLGYSNFNAASNRDSDLLVKDHNLSAGVVLTWIFKYSQARVDVEWAID